MQWDGTYVSVFDQGTSEAYQYTVSGTTATLKNTVHLTGAGDCAQTWIVKGLVYCGDAEITTARFSNTRPAWYGDGDVHGVVHLPLGVVAAKK